MVSGTLLDVTHNMNIGRQSCSLTTHKAKINKSKPEIETSQQQAVRSEVKQPLSLSSNNVNLQSKPADANPYRHMHSSNATVDLNLP